MKTINIENKTCKFEFIIKDDNKIALSYLGTEKKNFISEDIKESSFIEIETSEGDHLGNHCSKFLMTPYGRNCVYLGHEIKNGDNYKELLLTTTDSVFKVITHIKLYLNCCGFTIYNDIENVSDSIKTLEYVSSFYLSGIGNASSKEFEDMFIHYADNSWHCEAQWNRKSFFDEGIYCGNDNFTMKRYQINNTGSWSTKDYLPMCVIENAKTNLFMLSQIEHNGSWHFEIGDVCNKYYFSASGPEMIDNLWCLKLKANDVFTTVPVSVCFGDSFEKVIQEITVVRRNNVRKNKDNDDLPVIFNDYMHALWDTQTEELIRPLVDIAAESGCEEFVIDAGWFAKGCGWTNYIGNWKEYSENFPNGGLKGIMDYIHSKGMKAGLWVEIENMGILCPIYKELPEDWFMKVNGTRAIRNTRNCLNFDNPEVYKWAMDVVSELVEKYQLDYIKNDYNLDCGPGNDFGYDSLGDGLLKHNRALIRWLIELQEKYPGLAVENCGSGGCRMDYAMLKVCPIQSTSDQTDYRKYPYLSSAVLTACTPEQAAVWSYPVNLQIKEEVTDEVVAMNMVNAMLGRIHLSSYLNKLTSKQFNLVKEGVSYFKEIKEFKKNSLPIFPNGISKFFDSNVVGGLIKDKKILLCVWNTSGHENEISVDLSKYNIDEIKVTYPLSLNTNYSFDRKTNKLLLKCPCNYMGRCFEISLK